MYKSLNHNLINMQIKRLYNHTMDGAVPVHNMFLCKDVKMSSLAVLQTVLVQNSQDIADC